MPTVWYDERGGQFGPNTSWTTDGFARVGSQIPYWVGPIVPIGGTVAKNGFALSNSSVFGAFFGVVGVSALPAYIVGWRLAIARTSSVDPSASVVVSLWANVTPGPALDLATIPPLATATYLLSSLELVAPAHNYLLRGLGAVGSHPAIPFNFPFVELEFSPSPLITTAPTTLIYAVYLSTGFSTSANIVIGNGPSTLTGNSLALDSYGGGGSGPGFKTWFDRPNNFSGYDFENDIQVKGIAHQWGVSSTPTAVVTRGRSWSSVIG